MKNFEDYKKYTNYRFKSAGPEHPPLLRVAVELAEELLEYKLETKPEEKLKELGDICFWFGFLCYLMDYVPVDTYNCFCKRDGLEEVVKDILGNIKRYYRDDNVLKLGEIPILLAELKYFLCQELYRFGVTFEQLYLSNVEKLNKRFEI